MFKKILENDFCPKCGTPTKIVPAGISKKTGKPYSAFMSCTSMSCDWTGSVPTPEPSIDSDTGELRKEGDQGKEILDEIKRIHLRIDALAKFLESKL